MHTEMPFGKWKGHPLPEVPLSYLKWLLRECDNLDPYLRSEVRREVSRRERQGAWEERDYGGGAAPGGKPGLPASLPDLIRSWHRELVMIHHPDRGGDVRIMQALNDAHDRLKRLAGCA